MIMACTKNREFPPMNIDGQGLERLITAKLVGVYIQNDLTWDTHVDHMISKAKSRLYFMTLLKKAGLSEAGLLCFYTVPVFATMLPCYL